MTRFTEKEQKQLDKLRKGLKKNDRLSSGARITAYQNKFAKTGKMVKGKWRRWDKRTNTWYDPKVVKAYLNKKEYGTTTPKEDLKYLEALKRQAERESGVQYNDPARIKLSRKLEIDETNPYGSVYEKEQANRRNRDRAQLTKLRKKSSFVERDFGSNYAEQEKSLFIAAGDAAQVPGSDAYKEAVQKNRGSKGRRVFTNVVSGDGSPKTVPRSEPRAPAGYDLRSDIHTIDPNTGEPLGVMSRSARRKWEAANMPKIRKEHALKIQQGQVPQERKYYDKGKLLRIGVG